MSSEKVILTTARARIIMSRVASILARVERESDPLRNDLFQAMEQVTEAASGMLERKTRRRPASRGPL